MADKGVDAGGIVSGESRTSYLVPRTLYLVPRTSYFVLTYPYLCAINNQHETLSPVGNINRF